MALLPINELQLFSILSQAKEMMDGIIETNEGVLDSEDYIEMEGASKTWDIFDRHKVDIELDQIKNISHLIVSEYINQFRGVYA